MERRSRTILATAAIVGITLVAAPQWASGAPAATDDPTTTAVTIAPTTPTTLTATTATDAEDPAAPTSAPVTVAPVAPVAPAPTVADPDTTTDTALSTDTGDEAPTTAPTTTTAATTAPAAPAPQAERAATGTVQVDVDVAEGADRFVTLQRAGGGDVVGRVAVDGTPVRFEDLPAGDYDVLVEQFYADGATFLTRTPVAVDGGSVELRCDAETLDCTIA